jgi:hypothetical protein
MIVKGKHRKRMRNINANVESRKDKEVDISSLDDDRNYFWTVSGVRVLVSGYFIKSYYSLWWNKW